MRLPTDSFLVSRKYISVYVTSVRFADIPRAEFQKLPLFDFGTGNAKLVDAFGIFQIKL